MKKVVLLVVIAGAACAVMLMRKQGAGIRPTMWQRMQERMEQMPEDFPPRVMFENVAAVKENTEEILEMLRDRDSAAEWEGAEV